MKEAMMMKELKGNDFRCAGSDGRIVCQERSSCLRYIQVARDASRPSESFRSFRLARIGRNDCHYRIPTDGA